MSRSLLPTEKTTHAVLRFHILVNGLVTLFAWLRLYGLEQVTFRPQQHPFLLHVVRTAIPFHLLPVAIPLVWLVGLVVIRALGARPPWRGRRLVLHVTGVAGFLLPLLLTPTAWERAYERNTIPVAWYTVILLGVGIGTAVALLVTAREVDWSEYRLQLLALTLLLAFVFGLLVFWGEIEMGMENSVGQ